MLKFSVLGSSSAGNCTYVATDKTAVLVDAGLSARETCSRLANLGATPRDIQGVLVTHEHSDHTSGLRVLQRRYGVPLYANSGTIEGYDAHDGERLAWRVFTIWRSEPSALRIGLKAGLPLPPEPLLTCSTSSVVR